MAYKCSENYDYTEFRGIPFGRINGVPVPFYTTPELRAELKDNFMLRPDSDVFLVTYPKSGTTWVGNIIRKLLHGDDKLPYSGMPLAVRQPWLDYFGGNVKIGDLDDFPDPRVFKCHNHSLEELDDLVLKGDRKPKIIYVVRDPRDTAVSYYHHCRKGFLSQWARETPFDEFHKDYYRDENLVLYGLWEKHVDNWLSKQGDLNMLVLKYEDLISDPVKEIKRLAKFLGVRPTEDQLEEVSRRTSIGIMKEEEATLFDGEGGTVTDSMLRKGTVGDWKNHFEDLEEADKMGRIRDEVYKKFRL